MWGDPFRSTSLNAESSGKVAGANREETRCGYIPTLDPDCGMTDKQLNRIAASCAA
jgi:hypothetical protein